MPERVCETCGDVMQYHKRYDALWCPGCATPATMKERYQAARQMAEYHKANCSTAESRLREVEAAFASMSAAAAESAEQWEAHMAENAALRADLAALVPLVRTAVPTDLMRFGVTEEQITAARAVLAREGA